MDIKQLQKDVYDQAVKKGLYIKPVSPQKLLWHIRSEAQEAIVAYRRYEDLKTHYECTSRFAEECLQSGYDCTACKFRKNEGVDQEIADVIIMALSACEYLGIDAETAIATKMAYNAIRER